MARSEPLADPGCPRAACRRARPSWASTSSRSSGSQAAIERFGERFANRGADPARAALRPPAGPRRSPGAGRPRRPCPRCWAWACAGVGWKRHRGRAAARPASRRSASTAARPQRAEQLGMGRVAVSITPRGGVRGRGRVRRADRGRAVRVPARHRRAARRPRAASSSPGSSGCATSTRRARRSRPTIGEATRPSGMTDKRPVGFGRRDGDAAGERRARRPRSRARGRRPARRRHRRAARSPSATKRGHKGTFGKLLVIAGSLDYAGAALLVCRAAGRAGAGLVTLAVPESLQPLFAAKVVEATTMALPEDDVEEVDPEPALAKILDHEHDALVIGPGLRPSLAIADLLRLAAHGPRGGGAGAGRARRRGAADARLRRRLVDRRHAAVRPDAARRRVRAAPGRERPRSRRRTATWPTTTTRGPPPPRPPPRSGARSSCSRAPTR